MRSRYEEMMGPVIATLRTRTARVHFRLPFAMGKIRGNLCMRSHISVHRATSKYFSNSFVFKTEIEKEGVPRDSTPDLGAGGPRFKSGRPDQNIVPIFFGLSKCGHTECFSVEFSEAGGLVLQVIQSPMTSLRVEPCRNSPGHDRKLET